MIVNEMRVWDKTNDGVGVMRYMDFREGYSTKWLQKHYDSTPMFRLDIEDANGNPYFINDIVDTGQGIGVLVWMDDCLGIASGTPECYHAIDQVRKDELEEYEILGNVFQHDFLLRYEAAPSEIVKGCGGSCLGCDKK